MLFLLSLPSTRHLPMVLFPCGAEMLWSFPMMLSWEQGGYDGLC